MTALAILWKKIWQDLFFINILISFPRASEDQIFFTSRLIICFSAKLENLHKSK